MHILIYWSLAPQGRLWLKCSQFWAESWFSFCTEMAENWGGMKIAPWKSKVQHFTGTLSNGQTYSDIIYTHRDWNAGSWQEAGTCLLAYCITCLPELLPLFIQWGWQWGTEACFRVMVHQSWLGLFVGRDQADHATGIVSFHKDHATFPHSSQNTMVYRPIFPSIYRSTFLCLELSKHSKREK